MRCEATSSALSAPAHVFLQWRRAAIEGVRHRRAARGARQMREQPGGADGDAGIAGDRRHPQIQARVASLGLANRASSKCSSSRILPTAFSATPPVSTSRLAPVVRNR